ncbi:hypothetical protein BDR06DRAFT_1013536 [Suillus hirtellus]|nr:hypothetical protein BDR06DRAFT_1013536 [Suillus hirtellus]
MSSSDEANKALNLVTETICQLITRFDKLQVGDPAAKTLTHDIAVTLSTAFTQHGRMATVIPLILLSCTAKIWDKSGPDQKLKALPDWSTISDDNNRIQSHPLFPKILGYRPTNPLVMPPTHPTSLPSEATHQGAARAAPSLKMDAVAKKYNLVIPGNKHKAPEPEIDSPPPKDTQLPVMRLPRKASRAPPQEKSRPCKRVKSKKFVSDDEDKVLEDKVIYVKQKSQREQAIQPASGPSTAVTPTVAPPTHQPPNQCEQCIRDDIACIIPPTKRVGDVRRSCRNCIERKTKCIRLTIDDADLLRGHMALKKAKAATAANRKTKSRGPLSVRATRATSLAHVPSPIKEVAPTTDDSADEDADGEDEPEPTPTASTSEVAGPNASNKKLGDGSQEPEHSVTGDPGHVNNDIDMEISTENTLPAPLPIPTSPKKTNSMALQQPSLLDILWTIEALGKKFEGMVMTTTHASEALHQEMDGRVTALEEEWNQWFATMEAKIQEVEMKNHGNAVSIGHMANSFKMFSHTGKLGSFNHSTGPSGRSHPFGQLPATWMPGTMDASNHDQSVSSAGMKYTTAWDLSQGPQPSSLLTPSGSPVLRSGEPMQLPSSQPTGSFPPANPFVSK